MTDGSFNDWFVRPATTTDIDAIYTLAGQTGPGFTNLPHDREALFARLERSQRSFEAQLSQPDDELYMFALEEAGTGRIGGTALIFSSVGTKKPFYSYKLTRLSQHSRQLDRIVTTSVLNLVNDFAGASEVGGLFLVPELRRSGLGVLLARSRYLFMAMHRTRFGQQVLTELRGWQEPEGVSPFWEGLTRRFFDLEFADADRFHALNGNQFIADLMPKHPIYTTLLPPEAQAAIGKPHASGAAAMKLLAAEGFRYDGYVDLFDAGPTMQADVDDLRAVKESREAAAFSDAPPSQTQARPMLLAAGDLLDFRAWRAAGQIDAEAERLTLPADAIALGRLSEGATARYLTTD
ncbi:arginine N-succinyltransferase [Sphingobium sp. B1D7B]|uniref:arginine N-succinyltransferase n=1 Tax=unclassified Sphingobium TaxID=2611147 RepID=UPI0022243DF5|nr:MULTISPECIES: arginine N-succinyltransferase [unclassified Sphingobium]MCW2390446.1 arginine N-succinyltransferase [Sphingobium sp. B11D3A]MCW2405587.1 arginine N-succinyltransferase [Sphingobium sp. B1D7B]